MSNIFVLKMPTNVTNLFSVKSMQIHSGLPGEPWPVNLKGLEGLLLWSLSKAWTACSELEKRGVKSLIKFVIE